MYGDAPRGELPRVVPHQRRRLPAFALLRRFLLRRHLLRRGRRVGRQRPVEFDEQVIQHRGAIDDRPAVAGAALAVVKQGLMAMLKPCERHSDMMSARIDAPRNNPSAGSDTATGAPQLIIIIIIITIFMLGR